MNEKLIQLVEATRQAKDQTNAVLGIETVEYREGYAKAIMPLNGTQCNIFGTAHGGAIFTLADMAMGAAAIGSGFVCVTLTGNISYIKPGSVGPIVAEARLLSDSSRVAHFDVDISDANGEQIAKAVFTGYKKQPEFYSKFIGGL